MPDTTNIFFKVFDPDKFIGGDFAVYAPYGRPQGVPLFCTAPYRRCCYCERRGILPPPPKLYRKAPAECSPAERAEFAALVCKGGEVNSKGFDARISLAAQLVFLKGDTNLLGIAAIKNPLSGYRIFVSKNAGRRSVQLSFRLSLAGSLLRRTPQAKAIRMHW